MTAIVSYDDNIVTEMVSPMGFRFRPARVTLPIYEFTIESYNPSTNEFTICMCTDSSMKTVKIDSELLTHYEYCLDSFTCYTPNDFAYAIISDQLRIGESGDAALAAPKWRSWFGNASNDTAMRASIMDNGQLRPFTAPDPNNPDDPPIWSGWNPITFALTWTRFTPGNLAAQVQGTMWLQLSTIRAFRTVIDDTRVSLDAVLSFMSSHPQFIHSEEISVIGDILRALDSIPASSAQDHNVLGDALRAQRITRLQLEQFLPRPPPPDQSPIRRNFITNSGLIAFQQNPSLFLDANPLMAISQPADSRLVVQHSAEARFRQGAQVVQAFEGAFLISTSVWTAFGYSMDFFPWLMAAYPVGEATQIRRFIDQAFVAYQQGPRDMETGGRLLYQLAGIILPFIQSSMPGGLRALASVWRFSNLSNVITSAMSRFYSNTLDRFDIISVFSVAAVLYASGTLNPTDTSIERDADIIRTRTMVNIATGLQLQPLPPNIVTRALREIEVVITAMAAQRGALGVGLTLGATTVSGVRAIVPRLAERFPRLQRIWSATFGSDDATTTTSAATTTSTESEESRPKKRVKRLEIPAPVATMEEEDEEEEVAAATTTTTSATPARRRRRSDTIGNDSDSENESRSKKRGQW